MRPYGAAEGETAESQGAGARSRRPTEQEAGVPPPPGFKTLTKVSLVLSKREPLWTRRKEGRGAQAQQGFVLLRPLPFPTLTLGGAPVGRD